MDSTNSTVGLVRRRANLKRRLTRLREKMTRELGKEDPSTHYLLQDYVQAECLVADINQLQDRIRSLVETSVHAVDSDQDLELQRLDEWEFRFDEEAEVVRTCRSFLEKNASFLLVEHDKQRAAQQISQISLSAVPSTLGSFSTQTSPAVPTVSTASSSFGKRSAASAPNHELHSQARSIVARGCTSDTFTLDKSLSLPCVSTTPAFDRTSLSIAVSSTSTSTPCTVAASHGTPVLHTTSQPTHSAHVPRPIVHKPALANRPLKCDVTLLDNRELWF